jgi:hypothetical protein
MLPIGTSSQGDPYYYSKAKRWGIIGWLRPLIDILMSGNSETVHYELTELFGGIHPTNRQNYIRLESTVETAKNQMNLTTHENMNALEEAWKIFVTDNAKQLNKIIDKLIENK